MPGETLSAMTPDSDGISFEIERLTSAADGQFQVTGRWYGVRGRRFVRPTLTITRKGGATEQRVLADLEGKPWAAEDGEDWYAAFPVELEPSDAAKIELNVAPDITVELAGGGKKESGHRRVSSGAGSMAARSPMVRDDPARPRPRAPRSPEVERLRERLALAEAATTKERTKREAADAGLESERQAARKLQAEVGRLRAELDLAATVQRELDTATTSLDGLRNELRAARGERDRIAAERDETADALAQERAGAERLRSQLADAEAAVRRLTQAGREARTAASEPRAAASPAPAHSPASSAAARSASGAQAGRRPSTPPSERSMPRSSGDEEPGSGATERISVPAAEPGGAEPSEKPILSGLTELIGNVAAAARGDQLDRGPALTPRTERPVNPSLRASNWLGRGLALVVIVVVVIAIIIVINSTVA